MPTLTAAAKYARDLAERILWTFLQAFAGALIAGGWFDVAHLRDLSVLQAAGLAGVAAVLSLVKGLLAKQIGNGDSASTAPGV